MGRRRCDTSADSIGRSACARSVVVAWAGHIISGRPQVAPASEPRLPRTVGRDSYPQKAGALQIPRQRRGDRVGSGKQVSRSAHIGDAGIALIHQRVSTIDHVWHERAVDAGIDGTIELRDPATGEVSNCHLQVQSKASDNDFPW